MEFIENLVDNSMFYYILIAVTYILIILFVIMLLVNNKRKRLISIKNSEAKKKDLESVDLESVLDKMQESVEVPKEAPIMSFEQEQEEKAIISYQELLKAVKKDVNEVTSSDNKITDEIEVFGDPIEEQELPTVKSISPLEPIVLASEESIKVVEPKEELKTDRINTGFQKSEFISPVYGRVNNEIEYPKIPAFRENKQDDHKEDELGETRVFSPVKDVGNNDEFLKALKAFRSNLE